MGVFHVFKIVQIVPNRAKHPSFTSLHERLSITATLEISMFFQQFQNWNDIGKKYLELFF